ncbi:MAG: HIT family protein [Pseudobdellovibrio sp.]
MTRQIKVKTAKKPRQKKKHSLASTRENEVSTLALDREIWPIERDIFFRPGRMKYVRKLIRPSGCVFCHSAKHKISVATLCVYKTNFSQVLLNKFPYNNGHLLVLPLRHTGDLLALSDEEYIDLQKTIRLSVQVIKKVYNPQGFNLGLNHGASGGAGIPDHIHYHIVPRWNGDLNFFPLIAETKLVIEDLRQSYHKIKKEFQEIV